MDTRVIEHLPQLQSWFTGRDAFAIAGRFTLAGAAYLALYAGLDWISLVHEFQGLGISLWAPAIGLSMALLLTRGFIFAPLFFLAVFLTDLYVHAVPRSITSIIITAGIVILGYSGLVWILQRLLGFDLRRARLRDIMILLVVVPAGIIVISLAYCAALLLLGQLPAGRFWSAVGHFWVGDTVGTVIFLPAIMACFAAANQGSSFRVDAVVLDVGAFLLGLAGAFWIIFGTNNANEFQFFYLLFLPVIWIAIRVGFVGAAIGLLFSQVVLVAITKFEGYPFADFMAFQMLMLALSATGLLLGAMVTERREREVRISEQQVELSRMSRYATAGAMGLSLAHQISQPLSTVATYLHAVQRIFRSGRSDPSAIAEALDKAEAEAQRARELLESIRDFLSRGRIELAPVDLVALASRIALMSRAEGVTRDVQIRIEGTGPLTVRADRIQIEQLLLNLIANAVDAAVERRDGKGLVTVRIARREAVVSVIVEDNGPGIAPEIAERLLEPFETTKPRGMGLGLPLSKQIIESHGGRLVWVGLEPQGTRFMFELRINGPE